MGLWNKVKGLIKQFEPQVIELTEEMEISGKTVRLPHKHNSVSIRLGGSGNILHLRPDRSTAGKTPFEQDFLLFNPNHIDEGVHGFIRIVKGNSLDVGKEMDDQQIIFDFQGYVAPHHLTIIHEGDTLLFKDLLSEEKTFLAPLDTENTAPDPFVSRRREGLRQVRHIFGGPIEGLPDREALTCLEDVIEIMKREAHRPKNRLGVPGGILKLPAQMTPVIVGDLHAQVDNFLKILSENNLLKNMEQNRACLLLLGDLVHSEQDGEMEKMDSSLLIMDLFFKLKIKYPEQVFFVRGNHDSFSQRVMKGGISQGLLWSKHVTYTRGPEYKRAMEEFYRLLPFVALNGQFVACHAAPAYSKAPMEKLVNIVDHPQLMEELVLNRLQRPNYPSGYTKGDVKQFLAGLELQRNTPLIVGHNPLNEEETVWLAVGGIKNHHIVYSAWPHRLAVFTRVGTEMLPLQYRTEPLLDLANSL